MEWKNEVSPEQLRLPFEGLLDGALREFAFLWKTN